MSKRCFDVISFWDANLATRAAERPRPEDEEGDE